MMCARCSSVRWAATWPGESLTAVLYLMGCLAEKGRALLIFRAVRKATNPAEAQRLIVGCIAVGGRVGFATGGTRSDAAAFEGVTGAPGHVRLQWDDWLGAIGVFLLVFLSTFPVVIPFIFMQSVGPALLVSNAIAIVMLFLTGYAFGRMTGRHPWFLGIAMVVLGSILVGLTKALGG